MSNLEEMDLNGASYAPTIPGVLGEVLAERTKQDAQWGGPDHDDDHSPEDFVRFIGAQAVKCEYGRGPNVRERLVKIAALAVAAVESLDRQMRDYGTDDEPAV